MFEMGETGRKISAARKAKNMTQMELADQMGISFQAVSNWERGMSMPDISKLPELSELLGISIDELLGTSSDLVKGILVEGEDEYLKQVEETPERLKILAEDLAEAAPILKPEQVNQTFCKAQKKLDFSELKRILPFLGNELCDEIFQECLEQRELKRMEDVALFASREKVDEGFEKLLQEGKLLKGLVPFVSREIIDKTIKDELAKGTLLAELLPFASHQTVDDLAAQYYEEKGLDSLNKFLPHTSKEKLRQIAELEYQKNGLRHFAIIAPFLKKDYLCQIAGSALERGGFGRETGKKLDLSELEELFPFWETSYVMRFF